MTYRVVKYVYYTEQKLTAFITNNKGLFGMRTSLLSFSLLLALTTNSAFADSVDRQFEPKSYVKPPLHTVTPPPSPATPIVSKPAIKSVPLEVQRVQAKMQKRPHPAKHSYSRIQHHHRKSHAVIQHTIKKKNRLYSTNRRHHHLSIAVVYTGSLRNNIERIAREHGWSRVIWSLPEDYRWVGNTRISGHGIVGIFEKLLKSYPLQADFYTGNHVLVIVPRTLQ